jgi:hypothetical protein
MSASSTESPNKRSSARGQPAPARRAPHDDDLDSTVRKVHGPDEHGAAYDYTRVLGDHPLLANRAEFLARKLRGT